MNGTRKSAADREYFGSYIGLGGLAAAGIGWGERVPWLIAVGIVAAIIGGIMWGAGMTRRD